MRGTFRGVRRKVRSHRGPEHDRPTGEGSEGSDPRDEDDRARGSASDGGGFDAFEFDSFAGSSLHGDGLGVEIDGADPTWRDDATWGVEWTDADAVGTGRGRLIAPATVRPEEVVAYQIVVSNTGSSDATNVVVSDTLPAALERVIASASSGSCTIAAGVLTCTVERLPAGGQFFIAVNGYVSQDASGDIVNMAAVTSDASSEPASRNASIAIRLARSPAASPPTPSATA